MPVMHFHAKTMLMIARGAAIRARDDADRPNALTSDSILAIVMSAAATEAFINELAEHVPFAALGYRKDDSMILPPITACSDRLIELEKQRADTNEKYLEASNALDGQAFRKGAPPFQDFALLMDLRNAIMHVKPKIGSTNHSGTKLADALAQRGLAIAGTGDGALPWFDRLMTPAVAEWSHASALAIVQGVLSKMPVRDHYDPFDFWKRTYLDDYPDFPPKTGTA